MKTRNIGSPLLLASILAGGFATADVPEGYKLVYQQDFESPGSICDFVFANPDNWSVAREKDNGFLGYEGKSSYQPSVRSPLNIALLTSRRVGSFVFECDLMQTGRDYGHRDMCLFFNFQDPDHFYYSHLATKTDDNAHNIFIVKGAPRTKISDRTTAGIDWGKDQWHRIRVERTLETGSIKVYFDDLATPVMSATDNTFKAGWVGFGSFDDTGRIDNIKLWAPGEPETWRPRCFPAKPAADMEPQPETDTPGFTPLFDGTTLAGWEPLNGTAKFTVEDGCIVGTADPKQNKNTYLSTTGNYRDFIFTCQVKYEKPGNSGIQIRSRERPKDGLVTGYQIEIDDSDRKWTGGLYEERGRDWMTPLVGDGYKTTRELFKLDDWNTIVIKATGNHIQTWVNGSPVADYFDNDKENAATEGFIGLQVHWPVNGKAAQLRWRNLKIKELSHP